MEQIISGWQKKIRKKHPSDTGFLSHWDFINNKGVFYFTINPDNVPGKWLDAVEPFNVFEIPEVWCHVERKLNPAFDGAPWHEVEFVRELWTIYSEKPVNSVLEVCCGICPHGSLLARDGLKVLGVDSSDGMVHAVEARSKAQKLDITAYKRDVFQFSIPGDPPDAAIMLGGTFPLSRNHKTDNWALVSQLRSVGTFLKSGTIYVIDCGSPHPPEFVNEYIMSHPETVDLDFARVTLTTRTFPTDVETLATPFITAFDVKYPSGLVRLQYEGARSFISAQHLAVLVDLSRVFTLEAFHHWGSPDPGLKRDSGPYVAVLRRK